MPLAPYHPIGGSMRAVTELSPTRVCNACDSLQAEKIVRDQVQACGLTCYDILWTFHRLEVTVTRAEGDGPIEEAAYVDSDKLMQAIK